MIKNLVKDQYFLRFLFRFLLVFALGYFGSIAVIGLSSPGQWYSPFIDQYLDYISWMRQALLAGSQWMLSLFGIDTYITPNFHIRYFQGRGVFLAYDCIGYGVMSFWIALVVSLQGRWVKKTAWIILGLALLYLINIARISLFLVVTNKNTQMPLGLDHHTWFNIFAYLVIFILLYFFYRSTGDGDKPKPVVKKEA